MAKTLTFTKSDFRSLRKQSQQGGGNKETVELSAKQIALYNFDKNKIWNEFYDSRVV